MCLLEGNGRSICRWCRFEKCKEIGMDPEKVILDYDPTTSQKVPTMPKMDPKLLEEQSSEPEKSKEKMMIKIDFSELTKKETSEEEEDGQGSFDSVYLNDLQHLTKGLQEFRAPIWSKEEIQFILVSDDTVMMVDTSLVHIEEITELTDDYFRKLFHPFLNKYIEEVARPLSELDLTEEEVVFCMINILGFDVTDLTPETLEILHKFKEKISDQMHNYYMNSTNFKMYSHRIIKLMKLVNTMTAIAREKAKIKEIIWIFDIYKAEISDPYFFQMF
ncbi:hypothetical protein GCK72_020614 [Caenorhabditis remanei]|uniref:NR LBD domain-containing protein n=1 Tax=Caenorhabditis remanei TaxID=31234 RepID=A0A6A5GHB5_CAERE|nr:hypothetical protein GCK72_020614 [Caenorhabditis remanei]KAF1754056.1 hypothetical protein GCK72_020614 [Caenorhabditis remanei]